MGKRSDFTKVLQLFAKIRPLVSYQKSAKSLIIAFIFRIYQTKG
ncbi:hypothetical protein appser12_8560 [Actinobacillus pleuropneumoniae serovar 12 str. 1096]|uniref:Uncharacterized protein n=1 Tax=Actinobacillus pleuropneumoniae serovar 6 str. Femo TaxID=754256 RepID=A0A828PZ77_ACTPL|nr:hypothetical protein appser4_8230 [Actinobacillus pleuropneumoniae serovar 4 str. M62]EFM92322.1 hypothetical protein appser6_9020 [Actinobacillus pleuropneumoniae serovar 6 str. Femo]EFN00823.1 hypothetical protein appser12_8560 [Actinobacillus pleuropneumoniae serovar 12 str. 1096]EFN02846.1 hypothetical protein appser13_8900 [Actinobacillus pleuropneumoniae serovar 13 str. N273]